MAQLEEQFSLDRVSKSPAVFDVQKLRWINSQYLRALPTAELAAGLVPYVGATFAGERLQLLAETFANHLETFADIKGYLPLIEGVEKPELTTEAAEVMAAESVPGLVALFAEKIAAMETIEPAAVKAAIKACGKELGLKGAGLFMPLRIALTGSQHGPDIDKLAALMGKEIILGRLAK